MRQDIEALYIALTLGILELRRMTADASSAALPNDLVEAEDLMAKAAEAMARHIDPSNISILLRH